MPNQTVTQPDEYSYAGFFPRAAALLIDFALMLLLTLPVLIAIYGTSYVTDPNAPLIEGPSDFIISWILPAVAIFWFWMKKKSTPGKMALNIIVVDSQTYKPLTLNQCLLRYFGYYLSGMIFGIGFLLALSNPKKQALHDKISGSIVLRKKKKNDFSLIFDMF